MATARMAARAVCSGDCGVLRRYGLRPDVAAALEPIYYTMKFFTLFGNRFRLLVSSLLRRYADFRVGARLDEQVTGAADGSILLTFDDYGSTAQVGRLLEILGRKQVRAAFFVLGDWAEREPGLVDQIRHSGHILANHTYSHANLLSLDEAGVRDQIRRGWPGNWLRPPFGRYNAQIRKIALELGYAIKYWNIDSDDWRGVSREFMIAKIMTEIKPGSVILFHIHVDTTADAMDELIDAIRARGLRLCAPGQAIWGSAE